MIVEIVTIHRADCHAITLVIQNLDQRRQCFITILVEFFAGRSDLLLCFVIVVFGKGNSVVSRTKDFGFLIGAHKLLNEIAILLGGVPVCNRFLALYGPNRSENYENGSNK